MEGDDADLPVRGDVLVLVLPEGGQGVGVPVAGGLFHPVGGDAVEEGVDEAPGEVDLGGAPLVHGVVVDGFDGVEGLVLAELEETREKGHRREGQGQTPPEAPAEAAPGQKSQEEDPGENAEDARDLPPVRPEVIVLPGGDGETLLQAPEVLEHQGVVPELQHVVIPEAEAQHDDGGRQEGGPGAAIEAEEEKGQDHHRGKIQKDDPGVAEVAEEDRDAVGPGGVEQAQKPQGAAAQEEPEEAPPEPVPEGGEGIFRQNLIQGKVSFAGDSHLARRGFRRRPRTWPGSRPAARRSGSRRGRRWRRE